VDKKIISRLQDASNKSIKSLQYPSQLYKLQNPEILKSTKIIGNPNRIEMIQKLDGVAPLKAHRSSASSGHRPRQKKRGSPGRDAAIN